MERIIGYAASDVIGKTCNLIQCDQCFGKKCPEGIDACGILTYGGEELKECTLRHRDGYDVPVIKNAAVVKNETGGIIGVVETVTDLTALQRMRLKAAEAERRHGIVRGMGRIVGGSTAMREIYALIEAAGASDVTVLIQGESGTGKELVASAIHASGHRKDSAMVTVNCAALPESLLESELFGHVKGAFTGAVCDRVGRFEMANSGTIFLDEVGELSPYIQVKLLRVLQAHEIQRVGENASRRVDIRVIAATHRNLMEDIQAGAFRKDLYYRLKVFPLQLPPLRRRRSDIPRLIDHFIEQQNGKTGKRVAGASTQALRLMMDYPWPGNVRELENAIEYAFVLCNGNHIEEQDLPGELRHPAANRLCATEGHRRLPQRRRKIDKRELLQLLRAMDWNKSDVARESGLSRTSIWNYMKKYGIPLKRPQDDLPR